jgi:hypothetical protein
MGGWSIRSCVPVHCTSRGCRRDGGVTALLGLHFPSHTAACCSQVELHFPSPPLAMPSGQGDTKPGPRKVHQDDSDGPFKLPGAVCQGWRKTGVRNPPLASQIDGLAGDRGAVQLAVFFLYLVGVERGRGILLWRRPGGGSWPGPIGGSLSDSSHVTRRTRKPAGKMKGVKQIKSASFRKTRTCPTAAAVGSIRS